MSATLNQRWAAAIVGEWIAAGVRDVVICPGSRSAPLALAVAEAKRLKRHVVVDERSGGFLALGLARGSGRPAALVCTSGSAGAHVLPAVIEAFHDAVPLLIATADRPWELVGFGAPQTIEQRSLFGSFVLASATLGSPEESLEAHARAVVAGLFAKGRGPVHLNVPFREPLAPPTKQAGPVAEGRAARSVKAQARVERSALEQITTACDDQPHGVIVVGPRAWQPGFSAAMGALSKRFGYPLLAEATSNARQSFVHTDVLIRHSAFAKRQAPKIVLRFGGGLTPKTTQAWLDTSGARVFAFSDEGLRFDPMHTAEATLVGDALDAAQTLSAGAPRSTEWLADWQRAEGLAAEAVKSLDAGWSEPAIARAVVDSMPDGSNLFVASSMPIRDVEAFASTARDVRFFCNRGANGIDGMASTAAGVARGSGRPTVLLTGDLAALHDLSGWALGGFGAVVVNNGGGGIFDFLPIADHSEHFEELFTTPQQIDFAHVAGLGGFEHRVAGSVAELKAAMGSGRLVEAKVPRKDNVKLHRELFARVGRALEEAGWR